MTSANTGTANVLLDQDLYAILDSSHTLSPSSSLSDLSRHYRRQARLLHPDKNPNDPHANVKFDRLQQAYELLTDDSKRAEYDARVRQREERKRKFAAEDDNIRAMKRKLEEREQRAIRKTTVNNDRNDTDRIQRENETIIATMRKHPHPPQPKSASPSVAGADSRATSSVDSTTVVVTLASNDSEASLRSAFSRYGPIEMLLMKSKRAFVTYYDDDAVQRAVQGCEGSRWKVSLMGRASASEKKSVNQNRDEAISVAESSFVPLYWPVSSPLTLESLNEYETFTLGRWAEAARKQREARVSGHLQSEAIVVS